MLWLLTFLAIVIFLFCYVLFAPLYLDIDSRTGLYRIRFHKLMSLRFFTDGNPLLIELTIAGWKKQIDLSKSVEEKKRANSREVKKKVGITPDKVKAIFNSFKVNTFYLTLCADDMALNGILYLWFRWLKIKTGINIGINFWNKNEIELEVENNFFRIIRAYVNS